MMTVVSTSVTVDGDDKRKGTVGTYAIAVSYIGTHLCHLSL